MHLILTTNDIIKYVLGIYPSPYYTHMGDSWGVLQNLSYQAGKIKRTV